MSSWRSLSVDGHQYRYKVGVETTDVRGVDHVFSSKVDNHILKGTSPDAFWRDIHRNRSPYMGVKPKDLAEWLTRNVGVVTLKS